MRSLRALRFPRADAAAATASEADKALAEMHGMKADADADLRTGV